MMSSATKLQQKLFFYIPKFTSTFTLLGGLYVIRSVLISKDKRENVFHRLACAMAMGINVTSVVQFIGTFAMPKDTEDAYLPLGTVQTCSIQGAALFICNMVTFNYYSSLSLYSLIASRNKFNNKKMREYEWCFHSFVIFLPILMSIWGLKNQYFNAGFGWCWISTFPRYCSLDESVECIRGENYEPFAIAVIAVYVISNTISTICIILLYCDFSKSMRAERNTSGMLHLIERARKRKLKLIARQGFIYLFISWIGCYFLLLVRAAELKVSADQVITLQIISHIFYTLNGLTFVFVYVLLGIQHKKARQRWIPTIISYTRHQSDYRTSSIGSGCSGVRRRAEGSFSIFDGTNHGGRWSVWLSDCNESENESGSGSGPNVAEEAIEDNVVNNIIDGDDPSSDSEI